MSTIAAIGLLLWKGVNMLSNTDFIIQRADILAKAWNFAVSDKGSNVLILTAFVAVLVCFLVERSPRPKESVPAKIIAATPVPSKRKNRFSDFRVTLDYEREIYVDVWYFYDGALGSEDIFIEIEPVNNGEVLLGKKGEADKWLRRPIEVIGHKALARNVTYTYVPVPSWRDEEKSTHLQLSMVHNNVVFYRQTFPYKKVWK